MADKERDSSSDSGSISSVSDSEEKAVEPTIAQDIVVTKYNMTADIVNSVLSDLASKCVSGASVVELTEYGDQQLQEKTNKVFKKEKEMKKGIAFPTCISVNNCICHFSPLKSEGSQVILSDEDVVKIDLGAHIDGFIATVGHTVVVGASKEKKVTGRKADAILAAHNCLEAAVRMLRPGQHTNTEVTDTIQRISDVYSCKPVENMLSFQLKRNQIGSEEDEDIKTIIQNPSDEQRQKIKKTEFAVHEVYAIDVLISSGEGKGREMDSRTTVYKRKDGHVYQLKMRASRAFLSDADKRFGVMPFTLRMFEDEKKAKMGIVECERHELMTPFKVYYERENEVVAQFKSTVLIMSNGLLKVTGIPFPAELYESEHKIEDKGLKQLIASSLKPSKKKPKKRTTTGASEGSDIGGPIGGDTTQDSATAITNHSTEPPPVVEAVH